MNRRTLCIAAIALAVLFALYAVLAAERARTIANHLQRQGVDAFRVQTGWLASIHSHNGELSANLKLPAAGG